MKSEQELQQIAEDMITTYGNQAVATATKYCDRAAQAGNIAKAARWRKISILIDGLQRDRPPDTRPTCLICHLPVDFVETHANGAVEQFCKNCGGYKVNADLYSKWSADPTRYEQLKGAVIEYIEVISEEGETPILSELVMQRLKNWR